MLKKILGVVAGYAAWSILWVASTGGIRAAMPGSFDEQGGTDSAGLLLFFLGLSVVLSILAGWLTARIAGAVKGPALWTGALLLATGVPIEIAGWGLVPAWYHLIFLAALVPAVYAGGSIRTAPSRAAQPA